MNEKTSKKQVTKQNNELQTVKKNKSEGKIQQEMVLFFSQKVEFNKLGYIFSIANGGQRNAREAKFLKNTGLRPGMADLGLMFKGGLFVFVEVKTEDGRQSEAQKKNQQICEALGFDYYVCRTLQEFENIVSISLTKAEILIQTSKHNTSIAQ